MSVQMSWANEGLAVNHNALFEIGDVTSALTARDDNELSDRRLPRIVGKSAALRRVLGLVAGCGTDRCHGVNQRRDGNR
jgi:hypothetical protein